MTTMMMIRRCNWFCMSRVRSISNSFIARSNIKNEDDGSDNDEYYRLYKSSYDAFKDNFDQTLAKTIKRERTLVDSTVATLTHVDSHGKAQMVDVSKKESTTRVAKAEAKVLLDSESSSLIRSNMMKKGDVFTVAQLAGIMASKKTSELIPLCHSVSLSDVKVNLKFEDEHSNVVIVECEAKCVAQTGVEMEALVGVTMAALTVYDMCKAVNKAIVISDVKLVSKSGGKSGPYKM